MTPKDTPRSATLFFATKIMSLCLMLFKKRKKVLLSYHLLYPIMWIRLHHLSSQLFQKIGSRAERIISQKLTDTHLTLIATKRRERVTDHIAEITE
jgi:hypothetical protein